MNRAATAYNRISLSRKRYFFFMRYRLFAAVSADIFAPAAEIINCEPAVILAAAADDGGYRM